MEIALISYVPLAVVVPFSKYKATSMKEAHHHPCSFCHVVPSFQEGPLMCTIRGSSWKSGTLDNNMSGMMVCFLHATIALFICFKSISNFPGDAHLCYLIFIGIQCVKLFSD